MALNYSYPLAAVEFDLRAKSDGSISTFRICMGGRPIIATGGGGERIPYKRCLILPITLGMSIPADRYGEAIRGAQTAGAIEFTVDSEVTEWIDDYTWEGNVVRVLTGEEDFSVPDAFDNLEVVYTGRVANIAFDAVRKVAKVSLTGAALDLDDLYDSSIYGSQITSDDFDFVGVTVSASGNTVTFSGTFPDMTTRVFVGNTLTWNDGIDQVDTPLDVSAVTATTIVFVQTVSGGGSTWSFNWSNPESVANLLHPHLWGTVRCIAPNLINNEGTVWHFTLSPEGTVDEVRVGGVVWNEVSPPGPGEWELITGEGRIRFGGDPFNGEVRLDARSPDWATLTPAALVTQIVEHAGLDVDTESMDDLEDIAPWLIGYWGSPNMAVMLDEIMSSVCGWWAETAEGTIRAGLVSPPEVSSVYPAYTETEVASCDLVKIIPPVWRVRVQYSLTWAPGTQFFDSVEAVVRDLMIAPGSTTPPRQDLVIKDRYKSTEVFIRSLVHDFGQAMTVRDWIWNAYSVERKIYELKTTRVPEQIYSTIELDCFGIQGMFRIVSFIRSIGSADALHTIQVWG